MILCHRLKKKLLKILKKNLDLMPLFGIKQKKVRSVLRVFEKTQFSPYKTSYFTLASAYLIFVSPEVCLCSPGDV